MKDITATAAYRRIPYERQSELVSLATSIAALADSQTKPALILETVMHRLGIDIQAMLHDKMQLLGYANRAAFEADLKAEIEAQWHALHLCHLTAADRHQHHLINRL